MTKEALIDLLTSRQPGYLVDLGCKITDLDSEKGTCEMDFYIGPNYCHSVNIIQGGFVTAMLDAVSTHAVFASDLNVVAVSTLELKMSFYEASKSGKLHSVGRIEKRTRNFAFLSADLYNEDGSRSASLTATAKVIVKK